ncbi:hypothetical protein Aeqsu_2700 [Aequorivita sublithincola DSM 14238]|uniref:Secretion system C-terminal sorting domain-containing protein n=1 Tax=Aequorivita sublithincola (strain DSM 14238 / LMG 21431 / ACAM 643 / 9-3) TaxID=746697 RepID=I3YYT3_AEQSU|nr:T9SS type A sorting domain-containing protein [Aequorivita sublithincola]AFL82151.1 hypothetical protein Aeqsu_2700 [Aequorivita sublithincola DSM 14238]
MKTKNYITVISLAIFLFSFIPTVIAQEWQDLGNLQVNGEVVQRMLKIEGFGNDIYLCTDKGLFKSSDNGSTLTNLTWLSGVTQGLEIQCVYVDAADGNMYIGTSGQGVFKSTDNGNSWTQTAITSVYVFDIDKVGPNILSSYLSASSNGVYYSSDGLVTKQSSSIPQIRVNNFKLYNNTMFLTAKDKVFKSIDNGLTFSQAGSGLPNNGVYFKPLALEDDTLFTGSNMGGLQSSIDTGQTWQTPSPNPFYGNCEVYDIVSVAGYTFATVGGTCGSDYRIKLSQDKGVTWSSGLFNISSAVFTILGRNESGTSIFVFNLQNEKMYRMSGFTASIDGNSDSQIAISPNPTSGSITISGIIGAKSVAIYNTQGKLLKQYPEVTENKLINLSEFSSGLYFVNVIGEKGVRTFKVIKK